MNAQKKSGKPELSVEEGKKALFYAFVAALGANRTSGSPISRVVGGCGGLGGHLAHRLHLADRVV